jgi:unsaturated rhamnogalacturonyl hydrolase
MNKKIIAFVIFIFCTPLGVLCDNIQIIDFNKYPKYLSPKSVGSAVVNNLIARDHRIGKNGMHYSEVCTAYAAFSYAGLTGDSKLIKQLLKKYSKILTEYKTRDKSQNKPFIPARYHVDDFVFGVLPLEIFIQTGNENYLKIGLDFADKQWTNPDNSGLTDQKRWWIDDMYMVGMLQVQAYRATKKQIYIERASLFLDAYLKKLQQGNGLFRHGDISPFYWGRGNGWVAASLSEVLKELPVEHPKRDFLMKGYTKMMDSLILYQTEKGLWRQVIDKPNFWTETSSSAMFLYALNMGIKNGWLKDSKYIKTVEKGYFALIKYLTPTGELSEICEGTSQIDDIQYYYDRKRITGDFHGQAPLLWLANSFLQ